ncbi:MAG: zinc-binding dehydrogenase, partial [Fuerstiella sp.]
SQSSIEGFWLGNFMNNKNLLFKLRLVRRITKLILSGVLATEIDAAFPLEQIADAVNHAATSGRKGKTLLKIADA